MDHATLANKLVAADETAQAALLAAHTALADATLAQTLKDAVFEAFGRDPERVLAAHAALAQVAETTAQPEISAYAAWTAGIVALMQGDMDVAVAHLDRSAALFTTLEQAHTAAATQVSKLAALAMLGQYDEALACGFAARDVFVAHHDLLAAGKIEQNIGNLYHRREQYAEAESFYRSARQRLLEIGDQQQLAQVANNLANVLSVQHRFREADELYEEALRRAEQAGMQVNAASIEGNLGVHALFQGRYDRALHRLEQSRRRYEALHMTYEVATVELDLADVYLDVNLAPEAAALYQRLLGTFEERDMQAEHARSAAQYGRALMLLGKLDDARYVLDTARDLYADEGNTVGEAVVTLIEAGVAYTAGDFAAASAAAAAAEQPLVAAGVQGQALVARWLHGEALRADGMLQQAQTHLERALHDAEQQSLPQIAQRCLTSLGLLALQNNDRAAAEALLLRAMDLIENLRAPLPADEFRAAYIADKLTPYVEMTRICLADTTARVAEALDYVERAHSRALLDVVGGGLQERLRPRDEAEVALFARLAALREELNWFYSQLGRATEDQSSQQRTLAALNAAVRDREAQVLEVRRQLQQHGAEDLQHIAPVTVAQLQHDLGDHTALVEYFSLDGEFLAFVVTDIGVEVVRDLAPESEIAALVQQFQFQIRTLRLGSKVHGHLERLTTRAQGYLQHLYTRLFNRIEPLIGERRLLVVPHRSLHYVPFQALFDGAHYLIERREVCYAPSAGVLRACLGRPRRGPDTALLVGVQDARAPHVRDEVLALAPLFPEATTLLDEQATQAALHQYAPAAAVLHLACHGTFRPDNPLFSSLHLGDGWLTVRDAATLELNCDLVILSACETGISAVAPGNELMGLVRGFFAAGTPSLLVSLWTVDDATTASLMTTFYEALTSDVAPAAALRHAQRTLLASHPHPFFWSPFVLFGRW